MMYLEVVKEEIFSTCQESNIESAVIEYIPQMQFRLRHFTKNEVETALSHAGMLANGWTT
jgi:hypothetical protein